MLINLNDEFKLLLFNDGKHGEEIKHKLQKGSNMGFYLSTLKISPAVINKYNPDEKFRSLTELFF